MSSGGTNPNEAWGSRVGLILAMAGNAVGLGNFLRFPTQAASNGGGSFMVTYFIAFLLLGLPLIWIEWGLGRNGGRYRKAHLPGMFAAIWKHPAAKYFGVLGLFLPLIIVIYYSYVESWTLYFTIASLTQDYWGRDTQEAMVEYLRAYQNVGEGGGGFGKPFTFFLITLAINVYVLSRGISGGIEKLAKIGMPVLFFFAIVLVIVIFTLPPGPDGSTAATGLQFIYSPDWTQLTQPKVWLASAGQIFFTLSVGVGTLAAYASYLSTKDDILLSGVATASTNEVAEVVLGGSIAIPAAVVFFGVSGATAIANSGSYNIAFATMPVVFQQLPMGAVLGAMWFGLLFIAGITSSVALSTPMIAFIREEFGVRREVVAGIVGVIIFVFGSVNILWLEHGMVDEWDFWAGTFGLVVVGLVEVVIFMWVMKPEEAWKQLHLGADVRLPGIFKFVMTYITPLYLVVILLAWGIQDAIPILTLQRSAGGSEVTADAVRYIHLSRALLLFIIVSLAVMVRVAWKRNGYDDRKGFVEVAGTPAGTPPAPAAQEGR